MPRQPDRDRASRLIPLISGVNLSDQHLTTETNYVPTEQVSTDPGTGGDLLVRLLKEAGVEVVFGVCSIHNMPLVEAVARDLTFVPMRHEAAVVNAADGYARASGRFGVALTSTGTGAGNAAGAMLEALNASSKVLHITGNVSSEFLGAGKLVYHEVPRQLQMLDAVSMKTWRIERAEDSERVLREAIARFDAPPYGPLSVDWPIDLQYTAHPDKQDRPTDIQRPELIQPRDVDVRVALEAMRQAKRPLIWAGGGATEVGEAFTRLAEQWGAAVITGSGGRASISEDHELNIGNFPLNAEALPLIQEADLLLTVGSHLRGNETSNFSLPLPEMHIRIDVDEDSLALNYPASIVLHADARPTIQALAEGLGEVSTESGWRERATETRAAVREEHRRQIGAYAAICDSMIERLPEDTVFVRDVTIPGTSWGNRLLRVSRPENNIGADGGGIGQGLAQAVGAGLARRGNDDGCVLAITGDGGLQVHLGEFGSLAEQGDRVILTIFNDGGYGILRHLQEAKGGPHRAVDLLAPDFAQLSASFGLPYAKASSAEEFDRVLEEAATRNGPSVIEIDITSLDPQPEPVLPAIDVP